MWSLKFLKHPPTDEVEFSVNLEVNPLQFMYYPKVVTSLMEYLKTDFDDQMTA